jgi:hypothetical protein
LHSIKLLLKYIFLIIIRTYLKQGSGDGGGHRSVFLSLLPLSDVTFPKLDITVRHAECLLHLKCLVPNLNVVAEFTSSLKKLPPLSQASCGLLFTVFMQISTVKEAKYYFIGINFAI